MCWFFQKWTYNSILFFHGIPMISWMFKKHESWYKQLFVKLCIIALFGILCFILYKLFSLLLLLVFSFFFAIILSPLVNFFHRYKIPDIVSLLIVFISIFFVLFLFLFSFFPIFFRQLQEIFLLIQTELWKWISIYEKQGIEWLPFSHAIQPILETIDIDFLIEILKSNIQNIATFFAWNITNIVKGGVGIFVSFGNFLFQFFLVVIFTTFILLERKKIRYFFYMMLPYSTSKYIYEREAYILKTFFEWMKGQCMLAVAMFLLTFFWLSLLKIFWIHVKGIFWLAMLSAFMEFIPFIGTGISFLIALLFSLSWGGDTMVAVFIVYLIIQQIEGNILVPYIMGKTLELSPFAILVSMMFAGSVLWIIGVFFTIPVLSLLQIFLKDYMEKRKEENKVFFHEPI